MCKSRVLAKRKYGREPFEMTICIVRYVGLRDLSDELSGIRAREKRQPSVRHVFERGWDDGLVIRTNLDLAFRVGLDQLLGDFREVSIQHDEASDFESVTDDLEPVLEAGAVA